MARHGRRHRRHNRGNHGAYSGVAPARTYLFICYVSLAITGGSFLLGGTAMMATGFIEGVAQGIIGAVFFLVGAVLAITSGVLINRARKKERESNAVNQQVAGGTTLTYGQPVGTQPGTFAYGPGGGPIASQTAPPGVTIVYGPTGQAQPQTQAGFQPQPQQYPSQQYPATAPYPPAQPSAPYLPQPDVPYPPQPEGELAGQAYPPPPSYDEIVKTQPVADAEKPTT